MSANTNIKTVAVIGTGVIGSSYAALFLAKGCKVIASPSKDNGREKLKEAVANAWPTLEKMGLAEGASQSHLEFVDDVMNNLDRVDFVQENGPESLDYKIKVFSELDARAPPHVPLASSTSGFPSSNFVTKCTNHPERILIGHPLNPPHLIPAVEVVSHPGTDSAVVDRTMAFYRSLGQQPVRINIETPGFVLNRMQAVLVWEAYSLVSRGIISPGDLDAAITSGLGLRWALSGPFMNLSLTGGGGPDGFKRTLDHLGPPAVNWIKDIDMHRFELSEQSKEGLVTKVGEMFDAFGGKEKEFVEARNEAVVELVAMKKEKGKGLLK